ncbi:MAG: hypothetical protein AUH92_05985 [Acidobacteria bacterium 13_1_40CM_4_69_4]|nr:MAG: hypothetical protein AUH92_05985 [Acidobacteria bacterium 13_1_40CM_4_69_4]
MLAVLILAVCRPVSAQTWVTTTDDYVTDEIHRLIQTRDERFLAVADTGRALALIKRNSDGSLLWQRQLMGDPPGEAGYDVAELPDGRIVAAGAIFVNAHGNDDMALVILAPDAGTVLLERTFGGPEGDDRARDVVPTRNGGYLLIGETQSWGSPGRGMFVVSVAAAGDLKWAKVFRSANGDDILYSGVELPTGEFLVAGGSGSVLKLDASGGLVWSRTYGLTDIREIEPTSDGNFVMVGWRPIGNNDAAELIKLDATGQIMWRASYGQSGVTYRFFAVASLNDGGYLAGGEINGPGFNDFYSWLVRLDSAGNIVWQRHLDDVGGELHSVAAATDGSVLVGGHRESFPRMLVARLDSTGSVSSCAYPVTLATKMVSSGGWVADTRTLIDPATLVVMDENKPVDDALSPGDQTYCHGGPTYPPSEVSPPAASGHPLLLQDDHTLIWEDAPPSSSTRFHVYRGDHRIA